MCICPHGGEYMFYLHIFMPYLRGLRAVLWRPSIYGYRLLNFYEKWQREANQIDMYTCKSFLHVIVFFNSIELK